MTYPHSKLSMSESGPSAVCENNTNIDGEYS